MTREEFFKSSKYRPTAIEMSMALECVLELIYTKSGCTLADNAVGEFMYRFMMGKRPYLDLDPLNGRTVLRIDDPDDKPEYN